jgi:glycosyltransferase involved in cell wall biosynthesis
MSPRAPRVSIVVNNYNYGRFLPEAIDSALCQEHDDFEVVVVDDGSTDDSARIIARYGRRISAIFKPNGGQASALNAGFAHCRGELVLFLDADDVLLPSAAARLEEAMSRREIVKAHWPLLVIDAQGRRTRRLRPPGRLAHGDLRAAALQHGPTAHLSAPMSGNGFRRSFLRRVLPMEEALFRQGADTFLFELAPFFGPIARLQEPQSLYRLHGGNFHGRMTLEAKLRRQLAFYEHCCGWLKAHLAYQGVKVDLDRWHRHSWWKRLSLAIDELEMLPGHGPLILAEGGTWEVGDIGGRRRLPFTEHAGSYAGAPADDRHAVQELERLRAAGATTIAFAWPAFWWLDHYAGLARHLRRHYRCVLSNERLIVFELEGEHDAASLARDAFHTRSTTWPR